MTNPKQVAMFTGTRNDLSVRASWKAGLPLNDSTERPIVIVGCCPTGVDRRIRAVAKRLELDCQVFTADWDTHGRRAGPLRNEAMVAAAKRYADDGAEVTVYAFPKGRSIGTRGCIRLAQKAGLDVKVVEL